MTPNNQRPVTLPFTKNEVVYQSTMGVFFSSAAIVARGCTKNGRRNAAMLGTLAGIHLACAATAASANAGTEFYNKVTGRTPSARS